MKNPSLSTPANRRVAISKSKKRNAFMALLIIHAIATLAFSIVKLRGDPNVDETNFFRRNNAPPVAVECAHVDSEEDEVCGGLWRGHRYGGMPSNITLSKSEIHFVISHCDNPLHGVWEYLRGFNIASIDILSKCGREIIGSPDSAVVHVLPNAGRCNHTYAYFITTILPKLVEGRRRKGSIAVFLTRTTSVARIS